MKTIIVSRPKENFNKYCSYKILVRDQVLSDLKNGEEKMIELPPDFENEELSAKIQWCGSKKLNLKNITDNEKVTVKGNVFLNRKLSLLGAIFPLLGLIIFKLNIFPKNIGIAIFVVMILAVIGTLTIGKNKWLTLTTE
ncbi:hypothetical protein [Robertkochia solimangrovi]|uniref:hypothetical protein n=1 Tax=Robertkochia solimangrovi TaxID=2213046 RepID=UPI00117C5AB4|nr:hypothetical protein [Robertkochia solimangrovi]TRZ41957.1 hypothetical protein DMZ48_15070 [Robertkochia solimangrovi]